MNKFLRENGLTVALLGIFLFSLAGHVIAGRLEYNSEQVSHGGSTVSFWGYVSTGHFQESLFENWESEFLQMAAFVLLTIFLRQRGSSESKKFGRDTMDEDPRRARNRSSAPWPVRRGGWVLRLYESSLSIALSALFLFSFWMHAWSGSRAQRENALQHGEQPVGSVAEYLTTSKFWFESFQNWQSEFLSVAALVVLSIYLRQRGSSQSKPVAAPHHETGE
ncbi:MAG TPA: DUF6766 family protein [Candidatus Eisenbacteria bacterium]|nr:DUF6766 family protein [Candidatus Eisenbacteria bacterium]